MVRPAAMTEPARWRLMSRLTATAAAAKRMKGRRGRMERRTAAGHSRGEGVVRTKESAAKKGEASAEK